MKDEDYFPILNKIVSYCGYAERCFQDVDKRLYKLDLSSEIKDRILDYLIEYDVVNEKRYAFSFSIGKLRYNRWGRIKIKSHLRAKRISVKDIDFAFRELNEEEYQEVLAHVIERKYEKLTDDKFNKTVRHAQSRGFELSLIITTLNKFLENTEKG